MSLVRCKHMTDDLTFFSVDLKDKDFTELSLSKVIYCNRLCEISYNLLCACIECWCYIVCC